VKFDIAGTPRSPGGFVHGRLNEPPAESCRVDGESLEAAPRIADVFVCYFSARRNVGPLHVPNNNT
jgi:hypothetical protein